MAASRSDESVSLATTALARTSGERAQDRGVVEVERRPAAAEHLGDVPHDLLVDVDPAELVLAGRVAHELEATLGLAQHGRVEGAAAQVIDGHHRPVGEALLGGVVDRRRVRLAEQLDTGQASRLRGIHQPLAAVLAPVGGAGEDDPVRLAAQPLGDVGGHPGEQLAGELLGAEPLAVEQDRHLVAQPPFELLAIRDGSPTARRPAASPTSMTPSWRRNTTEGISLAWSPSDTTSARPSRNVAAAVKVVPTSMLST